MAATPQQTEDTPPTPANSTTKDDVKKDEPSKPEPKKEEGSSLWETFKSHLIPLALTATAGATASLYFGLPLLTAGFAALATFVLTEAVKWLFFDASIPPDTAKEGEEKGQDPANDANGNTPELSKTKTLTPQAEAEKAAAAKKLAEEAVASNKEAAEKGASKENDDSCCPKLG